MTFDWPSCIEKGSPIEDCPLSQLFNQCMLVHGHLNDLPSSSSEAQPILDWATEALHRADAVAETSGLFSDNEGKDDVATANLRYLLIPYLLAEVMAQTREREPRPRLIALSLACRHYQRFLKRCRELDLMDEGTRTAYDRQEAGEDVDPRIARTEKIERKRRELQVESRIQQRLKEQEHAAQREDDTNEASASGTYDEEAERELWTWKLELACIRSLDQRRCLVQEQEILHMMLRRQNEDPDEATLEAERRAQAEAEEQKALLKAKLLQIAADVGNGARTRQQMAADVFKPSHILPTYTVEQAGMIELRQAQEREARAKAKEAAELKRIAETDEDTLEEEELQKQRAWDDWKDDHPTGYGNSKLRPCAL